jgi:hypothetical protein
MGRSNTPESAAIQRFIRERQRLLLLRAIAAISVAAEDELAFQFHRLTGSLGTYQLHAASTLLHDLELRAQGAPPAGATPDVLRAEALIGLRAISAAMESAA